MDFELVLPEGNCLGLGECLVGGCDPMLGSSRECSCLCSRRGAVGNAASINLEVVGESKT